MTSIKFRALTHNDHKLFFEALGEHGKDFQNIQQYMTQKSGKNNNKSSEQNKSIDPQEKREQDKKEDDKKREQIRNFYNKLYTKLSQLIGKLDDRVEKVNQELYLLINYGEIWKKHGFKFNNKTKKLLEELVHQGYTTLRFKNKNVRLRTPPCKALKKINEIGVDEKVKVVTTRELPKDVIVEFHPSTNRDWLKIQSMSQNPLVRAKLSIQKRLSSILEFLENKWNVSQDKLNRTVDTWLKVQPNNLAVEDAVQQLSSASNNTSNGNSMSGNVNFRPECSTTTNNGINIANHQASTSNEVHLRLRLRPSAQHELKEVNITRVVPDNHLDLSLSAYISRIAESKSKNGETTNNKSIINKDLSSNNSVHNISEDGPIMPESLDNSQAGTLIGSRLANSLNTPDSSILLERSCTSEQPSIVQARKHLTMLQCLAGSFEGCDNSRTACEDTQDRSLLAPPTTGSNRTSSFMNAEPAQEATNSATVNNNIPALFDEDAVIVETVPMSSEQIALSNTDPAISSHYTPDSQNSKSVDFHIPKNVTIGAWFANHSGGGDDANDAFPIKQAIDEPEHIIETIKEDFNECPKPKIEINNSLVPRPQNHLIEIKKLAEGWTRLDDPSMTIGELYLAFKCPDKIVLEYGFEQFTFSDQPTQDCTDNKTAANKINVVPEPQSNSTLMFKLLTAASLSLAHIESQKEEQRHKALDQSGAKLKRRKGPSNPNTIKFLKRDDTLSANNYLKASASRLQPESDRINNSQVSNQQQQLYNINYMNTNNDRNIGQNHNMTLLDIEATNQRVEEALKQLQPTRLSVFRRAR